jgi:hypothetical protein
LTTSDRSWYGRSVLKSGNKEGSVIRRIGVVALCALALPVAAAQAWTWPADGPVLRPFSFDRAHPYAAGQHRGIDLGAPSGADVRAPAGGTVTFTGTVPTGGKTVSIETTDGYTATLLHLGSIGVRKGQAVTEGSVVGTIGPSGVMTGTNPFVYFGVRRTSDDQGYVDPLKFLPSRPAAQAPVTRAQPEAAPAALPVVASPAPSAPAPEVAVPAEAQPAQSQAPVAEMPVAQPDAGLKIAGSDAAPVVASRPSALAVAHAVRSRAAAASPPRHVEGAVARALHRSLPWQSTSTPVAAADARRRTPHGTASVEGRSWQWPAGLSLLVMAACLGLWRRRKRVDARPIMAVGEQLLHHDTDLLRQLDAAHRPRVHHDRGRHPRAPSQAARRRDVLPHGNGRARLEGLPGGRGAGARPEDLRRPDRRVLERAA